MSSLPPISLATLRAVIEGADAPPRRRHGQHYLQDANLLAAIVRDAGVGPEDVVLEIGPGPGLLTRHLLATGARVRAVEVDARLRGAAQQLIEPAAWSRVEWVHADALDGPKALSTELLALLPGTTCVVSNLPYNVAAPLIVLLLEEESAPDLLVVMVQAEMGRRLLAAPGGRDYGGLAVIRQLCADGRVLRRVPPKAFWPAPKVDSMVIELIRKPRRPSAMALDGVHRFLALAFQARRKTLPNSVSQASGISVPEVCRRLGLDEKVRKLRAEAFDPVQFCALAHSWAAYAQGGRKRP